MTKGKPKKPKRMLAVVYVRMSHHMRDQLQVMAHAQHRTLSGMIRRLLKEKEERSRGVS